MTCVLDDEEQSAIKFISLMNSLLIIFVFDTIICCTCKIFPRAVEHRPRREKKCLLGVRQSESQTSLLARKLKFCSQQVYMLLMRLRGCASWSAPLLLQITQDRFSQSRSDFYQERSENKMRNWIIVKSDNSDRIAICAVSSKHLQCVCRHIKSYPARDRFLYRATYYTKVNMVII